MKAVLLWFATLLLTCAAEAQFYAPPVDFHDAAQRRFPVEAARVLAWLHQGEPAIVEITYQVQTDSNGETVWKLEWKPAAPAGRARTAAVRYPESALRKGADWYRDVWQQLAGADWALPKSGDPALEAAFWQGAEGAGLSRMEGIAAALKQAATTPQPAAADSARLAGTLAQSALPLVDHCLTLDGALLARSAAWLCAAEQQAGARTAAPWAPLLALAGRGPESLAAWSASEEPSGTGAPCWRAWDILIRLPPATVGLPLIAQPENRLLAAPVFFAYVEIDPEYRGLLGDLAPRLFPGDRWTRLYDYGAGFMRENAHRDPLAEDFPARGLRAWLGVLRQLTPAPGDAAEAPALGLAVHDYDREISALRAPSAELAGLLNAAIHQGDGPLVPVAVVTARDLLLYGWESAGLQFGTLHTAFSVLQNGRDKARDLEKNWFGAVEGWAVFTQNLKLPPFAPLPASDRYEFIRSSRVALELIRQPPAGWPKTPDAYGRRRWLSDPHRALDFLLQQGGHAELATRFVRRSIAEGSERNLGDLLTKDNHFMYDVPGNQWQYGRMVDLLKLRGELTRAAPLSVSGPREALRQKYADQKDPLAYAQALERLHWQSGLACAPSTVFVQYVRARAFASANRFYDRWHEAMLDRYDFETTLGPANFALAVLQSDPERAQAARRDCGATLSGEVEITTAFLAGRPDDARPVIEQWLQRFPRGRGVPNYEKLRDYLPLIPALNDPASPDHAKALEAYPRTPAFLLPQWALLSKAHLPPAEAAQFLEAGDDQPERRLAVAALRGDKVAFARLEQALTGATEDGPMSATARRRAEGSSGVLQAWLRNLLFATPPPKAEPDLAPAGATPLLPRLRAIAGVKAP